MSVNVRSFTNGNGAHATARITTGEDIPRRVCIQQELAGHADWYREMWATERTPDEHKALGLLHSLGHIATAVCTGKPNRKALLRIAGAIQAWVEHLDREAA